MADDHIKMTIGAMQGASVKRVFDGIRKQAKLVGKEMSRYLAPRQGIQGLEGYRKAIDRLVQTTKSLTDVSRRQGSEMRSSAQERIREARQLEGVRKRAQDAIHSREMRNIRSEGQLRRREAQSFERRSQRFARMTSHRATRFFWPNAPLGSMARRGAMNIAHGIGLNTNTSMGLSNSINESDLARKISTQAYSKGAEGPAGERVDPVVLKREMRDLVRKYGTQGGTMGLLRGADAFVGQRGNLQGFRDIAERLTKRVTAYQLDAGDVGLQAAKIESALANQAEFSDDGKRANAVMALIDNSIQQGKVGSIEGGKLAKELPKLSGIAGMMGGDVVQNLKELVTMAQLAERGPAKNSATASTFAQNFALDVGKRSKQFADVGGVEVFDERGKVRSFSKWIPQLLANTEGTDAKGRNQVQQLQAILPNKRSFLALQEWLTVFQGAGGGAKGRSAVEAEFAKFAGGSVTDQVESDLAERQKDMSNRVEKMNAALGDIYDRFLVKFVPALEEAEPALMRFVEVLGSTATWVLENPKKAIALAMGASIARAGIESAVRVGLERLLAGAAGQFGASALVGGATAAAGTAGAAGSGAAMLGGGAAAGAAGAGAAGIGAAGVVGVAAAGLAGFGAAHYGLKALDSDYGANDRGFFDDLGDIWDFMTDGKPGAGAVAWGEAEAVPSGRRRSRADAHSSSRQKITAENDPATLSALKRSAEASEAAARASQMVADKLSSMPGGGGISSQHGDPP